MTLNEAKDQVAVKHYEILWMRLMQSGRCQFSILERLLEEAAELYARSKWDEACELQRNMCADDLPGLYNSPTLFLKQMIKDTIKPEFQP